MVYSTQRTTRPARPEAFGVFVVCSCAIRLVTKRSRRPGYDFGVAPEPLHVDPERLAAAARQMLAAAEMPTPPAQQTVTGSDPLSQAIAAQTGKVEAAITEGLPEQTDREIADRIKRATFPKDSAERHGAQAVGYGTKPERPSGPFPEEPPPGMSRKQAADGLKDVNARIAAHNAELPYISTLPPHDPRRTNPHPRVVSIRVMEPRAYTRMGM